LQRNQRDLSHTAFPVRLRVDLVHLAKPTASNRNRSFC
jgi:hypothetical protein